MSLALSVADKANSTGATVAVLSDAMTTVNVWRATVVPSGAGSYSNVGSRVGTGSVTISPNDAGYYSWYAENGADTTTVTYRPITADGDSVHERCLQMIHDRIVALGLTTLEGTTVNVEVRQMASKLNLSYPSIIVAIAGEAEQQLGGSNMSDDYGFPAVVYIAEKTAAMADEHRARHLMWREKIHRRIDMQKWDRRVPEVWECRVRTGPIIDIPEQNSDLEYRSGSMLVTCVARLLRNTA